MSQTFGQQEKRCKEQSVERFSKVSQNITLKNQNLKTY